jgi:hypothetical protein
VLAQVDPARQVESAQVVLARVVLAQQVASGQAVADTWEAAPV